MTRSTKLILLAGALTCIGMIFVVSFAIYYLIDAQKGARLASNGYEACLRGDYDDAITQLSAALATAITSYQKSYAYLNRGFAYNRKWRFDQAIQDFNAALKLNPELPEAYADRGVAYHQKGDIDQAIADLNQGIDLNPNLGFAHYERGLIFLDKQDWDKAIADFAEAARCDPANAEALVNEGIGYRSKKDYQHALASFDGAISIDPKHVSAYKNRGELYREIGQLEKSASDQAEVARLNPPSKRSGPALSAFSLPAFNSARSRNLPNPSAGTTFDTAIKGFSEVGETAEGLTFAAQLAYNTGEVDHAIELCNQALAKNMRADRMAGVVLIRANAYLKKGNLDSALHDFGEVVTLNPNQIQGYVGRAMVFARQKDYVSANNELDVIVSRKPKPLESALNSVAWIRATSSESELRNGKKALEAAEQACELSKWRNWKYVDTLAAAFAENGDFDKAANYQAWVLEQIPANDKNVDHAKERLALYKQHKPYRQPRVPTIAGAR